MGKVGSIEVDEEKLRQVAQEHGLALVILHGSHVDGRARPDSDIDVGVWAFRRPFGDREWVWKVIEGLEEAIREHEGHEEEHEEHEKEHEGHEWYERKLDIAFLNSQSPILLFEVATRGKVLYEAEPGLFSRFCVYAAMLYDDHRPLFEEHRRYLMGIANPGSTRGGPSPSLRPWEVHGYG